MCKHVYMRMCPSHVCLDVFISSPHRKSAEEGCSKYFYCGNGAWLTNFVMELRIWNAYIKTSPFTDKSTYINVLYSGWHPNHIVIFLTVNCHPRSYNHATTVFSSMRWCAFTQNEGHDRTAEMNLLPAVHHLDWRVDSLDFIRRVFQVNILPVLTVGDPVTPALPVSSNPGVKRRHSHDMSPHWHAQQRVGSGGEFRSSSNQTSWGFTNVFPLHSRLHFRSKHQLTIPKPRQLC